MSETRQEVPWAEGRRAWVMDVDERLLEGVGERHPNTGEAGWRCGVIWLKHLAFSPARLLPGQCRECYEVDTHTSDCARGERIAENLARGVPAFWAEWAMWALPSGDPGTCAVFELRSYEDGTPRVIGVLRRDWRGLGEWGGGEFSCAPDGCASTFPLIALGPEGPTLAPWGL